MQDPFQDEMAVMYGQWRKQQLIREIVAASINEVIAEIRDGNRLRRRYLDETMVSASPIAIAAGLAP